MANILILDDDTRLARQLSDFLTKSGHVCRVEPRGDTALTFLDATRQVDLLILDIMLPGISGFEVCRRVRAHAHHFRLPILLISAMTNEEEIGHGLAQGADDYLTKPLDLAEVLQRVNRLLSANSLRDDLTELPDSKGIRLEVQRALSRRDPFAIIYVELLNLAEFGRSVGADGRAKAIRHLGRGLHAIGQETQSSIFRVGHLGGGHFVVIIDPDNATRLCKHVQRLWQEHLPRFYESVGQERAFREAMARRDKDPNAPLPILDILFCVAVHDGDAVRNAQELFDVLSHLREGALAAKVTGIYTDRRH